MHMKANFLKKLQEPFCLILSMFYIDSICWSISSSLYLPQLAGVPLCSKKNMQSAWDWYKNCMQTSAQSAVALLGKVKEAAFSMGVLCSTLGVFLFFHTFMILSIWLQVLRKVGEYNCRCALLEDSYPVSGYFWCFWCNCWSCIFPPKRVCSLSSWKNLLAQFHPLFQSSEELCFQWQFSEMPGVRY